MPRNRKAKLQKPETPQPTENIEISEEDQWRIIKDSGILNNLPQTHTAQQEDAEELDVTLGDEIFNASLLVIPMSFLLLLMEMYVCSTATDRARTDSVPAMRSLVHYQYGRKPTYEALAERMLPGVPSMSWLRRFPR